MKLWIVLASLCLIVSPRAGIGQSQFQYQPDPVSFPGADFDGDGRRDILWEHTDGSSEIWLMNGTRGGLRGAGTGWSVQAFGDFDGNGKTDIVWVHTDGSSEIWLMDGVSRSVGARILDWGTGWSVKAVGDFEGNGKSDMVWQHTDGSAVLCLMNGITGSCRYVLGVDTGWSVRTLGDFDGNGKSDIVWQHTDGSSVIWWMDGFTYSVDPLFGAGTGWSVKGVGDFDGDGKSDILWQHTGGNSAIWVTNGGGTLRDAGTGWTAKAVGDFDGDGKSDILWEHTDGRTEIWLMNGVAMSIGGNIFGVGTGWSVKDVGDFDGDLKSDIIWRHADGAVIVWLMNGLSVTGSSVLMHSGTGWVPGFLPTPTETLPPPPPALPPAPEPPPAPATNAAPVVNAGADQSVTLPAAANLNGTAYDDGLPAGSLTTTWGLLSGPAPISFGSPANLSTSATFSAAGTYTLRLTATDGVLTASDDIVIVVNSAPLPPPTVTTYDFSLGISGPTRVVQGHSLYLGLQLALLRGTRNVVDFSVAGLPSGATASFPELEKYCCGGAKAWEPGPTTLRITTTQAVAQGSFPITVSATSGGVTKTAHYAINIDPVPSIEKTNVSGYLSIPSLAQWEANMTFYGQKHCATLQDPTKTASQKLDATYYDAERVYLQIAAYTASPTWNGCGQAAERVYRDTYVIPNNGRVPGYWNFTTGQRHDYELTGDTASRNGVLMLAQNAIYAANGPLTSAIETALSREISYAIVSYVDSEMLGAARNPQLEAYIDIQLGHFDQWFVSKTSRCLSNCDPASATGKYYVQPFMVGIAAEALIAYYQEIYPDPRIPNAVKIAADWLWTHAWDAPNKTFWYENQISDPSQIPSGYWPSATFSSSAPDLNLLIAPAYAWLYRMTGDTTYRDQGDQVFVGGVANSWLDGPKQFNQNYRWSFAFVKWRSAN